MTLVKVILTTPSFVTFLALTFGGSTFEVSNFYARVVF